MRIVKIVATLVTCVLLLAPAACGGGGGGGSAPTQTAAATATPSSANTANMTSLLRSTALQLNLSGYELLEAFQELPKVTAIQPDVPFDDSYDISSLVLSLTPAEQDEFGIQLASQLILAGISGCSDSAPAPCYNIRVHVILCANDDGSGGAADANAVTPAFFAKVIAATNKIYADAGIQLVFNPNSDFEKRNSSLLNLDFTMPSYINYWSPATVPPISDADMKQLAKPNADERQRVGREYRGKMVLLLCDGNMLVYDSSLSRWKLIGRTYAFSGEDCEFVALPTGQGDVQGWANLLGHESGHYFHQWHPQVEVKLTGVEDGDTSLNFTERADILENRATSWVKDYIDQGHSVSDGLNVFDADISQVSDTPPDPGPEFFRYLTGNECGAQGTVQINVPLQYTTMPYTIQPDRANVVSYFKHCTNIPQHFSSEQIAGMRKSLEEENRWHLIGTEMRLMTFETCVLYGQPLYSATWRPGDTGEIQIYGASYEEYRAYYDELWNQDLRLYDLDTYVLNGQVYYNAVWRPGSGGEIQIYGASYTEYRAYYDEKWNEGWRLKILDIYTIGERVYYTAVWQPSTEGEIQIYGASYEEYRAYYDELWNEGWRLKMMENYVVGTQVYYTAVWKPSTEGEIQFYGATWADIQGETSTLWNQGMRIGILDSYVVGDQLLYTAVWKPSTEDEISVYGWNYTDFRAEYDKIW